VNYDALKLLLDALALFLSIGAMGFAWVRTRGSKVDERFEAGADRMDRHEARIQSLEHTTRSMPGRDDIHKLELQMSEITGLLSRMDAVMDGNSRIMARLESIVTRHEEHLLNRS
jgi:hypothetical protein